MLRAERLSAAQQKRQRWSSPVIQAMRVYFLLFLVSSRHLQAHPQSVKSLSMCRTSQQHMPPCSCLIRSLHLMSHGSNATQCEPGRMHVGVDRKSTGLPDCSPKVRSASYGIRGGNLSHG